MNDTDKESQTQLATVDIPANSRGVALTSYEDMLRFSQAVSKSGLAPKGMERPEAILVAIQMGLELGLSPMGALQNIAVINGRPGIFGDAALALVRNSGLCESYKQNLEGEGDNRVAVVRSARKGEEPLETRFSVADAKKAQLWGKSGPWTQYPERMLMFRARGFNLRDNFSDVLKGFKTTEELQDYPATEKPAHARVVDPEPLPPAAPPAPDDILETVQGKLEHSEYVNATYYGKIGHRTLWTKEKNLGEELLAANGLEIIVQLKPGSKENLFQLRNIQIPEDAGAPVGSEIEPDDIPF